MTRQGLKNIGDNLHTVTDIFINVPAVHAYQVL